MTSKLIYVTYASGPFERNLKPNGWFARHGLGADEVLLLTRQDLEADPIYIQYRDIFDARRGAGFYAWKAWCVWKAYEAAGQDDIVVYHDCGTGLRYKTFFRPTRLLALALKKGCIAGVRSPQYGPNRKWNSRKCLKAMNADREDILNADQIETSISVWPKNALSELMLAEWKRFSFDFDSIRDATPAEMAEQYPDFVEHRYDQSIMTNLAWLHGAGWVDPRADVLPFAKSITMIEIELRARESWFWRLVSRVLLGGASLRRRLRG